jgi:hypothetical protein
MIARYVGEALAQHMPLSNVEAAKSLFAGQLHRSTEAHDLVAQLNTNRGILNIADSIFGKWYFNYTRGRPLSFVGPLNLGESSEPLVNTESLTTSSTAAAMMKRGYSPLLYSKGRFGKFDHRPKLHAFARTSKADFQIIVFWSKVFSHIPTARFFVALVDGVLQECIQVNTHPTNIPATQQFWSKPQTLTAFFKELEAPQKMLLLMTRWCEINQRS